MPLFFWLIKASFPLKYSLSKFTIHANPSSNGVRILFGLKACSAAIRSEFTTINPASTLTISNAFNPAGNIL